ncbi:unnamed protein product, partial [marine sediment metagenome]
MSSDNPVYSVRSLPVAVDQNHKDGHRNHGKKGELPVHVKGYSGDSDKGQDSHYKSMGAGGEKPLD